MKSFIKFLLILVCILLASAILAPILFDFLPFKFEKIFNRLVMIFSLVAVVLFVRIRRQDFGHYGLRWRPASASFFLGAFAAGFVTLFLLTLLRGLLGNAVWAPRALSALGWTAQGFEFLGSALLIGLIEEFFFRGFVFTTLKERFMGGAVRAFLVTNVFYSLLHFIDIEKPYIGPDPTFVDSLRWMGAPFASLHRWREFWPAAIGLFLFGVILNWIFVRSGSLYPAIGLHAGCVFFIKLDGHFVDFLDERSLFFGSKQAYDGVLGWLFLAALALALWRMIPLKSFGEKAR